jgi:hypothetical protein
LVEIPGVMVTVEEEPDMLTGSRIREGGNDVGEKIADRTPLGGTKRGAEGRLGGGAACALAASKPSIPATTELTANLIGQSPLQF